MERSRFQLQLQKQPFQSPIRVVWGSQSHNLFHPRGKKSRLFHPASRMANQSECEQARCQIETHFFVVRLFLTVSVSFDLLPRTLLSSTFTFLRMTHLNTMHIFPSFPSWGEKTGKGMTLKSRLSLLASPAMVCQVHFSCFACGVCSVS